MRRRRRGFQCRPAAVVVFAGALLCLCFLSAKFLLIMVALALIAAGVWLLRC